MRLRRALPVASIFLAGALAGALGTARAPARAPALPVASASSRGMARAIPPNSAVAAARGAARAGAPSSAAALLHEDKGKFRIVVDGQQAGIEDFQISREGDRWVARGKVEVTLPGSGSDKFSSVLDLAADGAPSHYEWSSQGTDKRSIAVDFQGTTAKMALSKQGAQPFVQEFSFSSPRILVLDNNMYHHFAILAQLYDWNAGGKQTFPVLIPQDQLPGTITVESLGSQSVEGAALEQLRVHSADLEIDLYVDSVHRLTRLEVPSSKAEVIRE
jgi:hypothetical protein